MKRPLVEDFLELYLVIYQLLEEYNSRGQRSFHTEQSGMKQRYEKFTRFCLTLLNSLVKLLQFH